MKIKLFAAAAASLVSAGAFAQSSVTLYGVVDAGVEWVNKAPGNGGSRAAMQSGGMSGSRWGLRGVEDLGGGLKGIFNLESGFNIDDGRMGQGDRLFGRNAYVGLQGQWGQLTLGRQQNLLYDFALQYDPMATARYSIASQDNAMVGRADNAVKYIGTFGGLTASALYSMRNDGQEIAGNYKQGREWSAGLNYAAGPFALGAVYDETNGNTAALADAKVQRATIAGTYVYGPAKLYAGYRWRNASHLLAADESSSRSNMYWLGAGYQATPALTLTGTAYYQNYKTSGTGNPWLFVVGSDYALSKRTDAYLNLAYAKNSSGSALGVAGMGDVYTVPATATSPADTSNQMGAMVGIRHKF
ncbi:porin [Ralstonia sp. 24A2]|uniref:porin n=1 Tax=Ralstonia sp. 24A2 TaxID=3447364 RepID=UPI003F6A2300